VGGVTAEAAVADRAARMRLSQLVEPGDERLGQAVLRTCAADVLQQILGDDRGLPGVEHYRTRLALPADHPPRLLAQSGGRFVVPGDGEWPTQLDALGAAAPLGLYVVGTDLRVAAVRSVAIVGSRAATQYGAVVASELATDLSLAGWTVISGGAYGIDAAAHRGALVAGGNTAAVLACGVDSVYPRGHVDLFERICAGGGVLLAELPPGATPTKPRFLQRNRVIAALTRGTVVVEAQLRSGALNTAAHSRRLGRPVMVVPGPVTSANSAGCHRLARDVEPARIVTTAAEVIEEVGLIGELAPRPDPDPKVRDTLAARHELVLEAMPAEHPVDPVTLSIAAGLSLNALTEILAHLRAKGLVRQVEEGLVRVPGAADVGVDRRGGLPGRRGGRTVDR
jgi:DNA processing protein